MKSEPLRALNPNIAAEQHALGCACQLDLSCAPHAHRLDCPWRKALEYQSAMLANTYRRCR